MPEPITDPTMSRIRSARRRVRRSWVIVQLYPDSKGDHPFHDFHRMTADPHVCYAVAFFAGAHEQMAGALDLDALQDVNRLVGLGDSVAHHPSRRAPSGRARSGVFVRGKDCP